MLVLSRKERQQLIISNGETEIRVTLCDIRGDKARIGIEAPQDWSIKRPESASAIASGNREDAHASV